MTTSIALLGAGAFGALHARVLASLPGVRLALVADPDEERAAAVAAPLKVSWSGDINAAIEDGSIDAVVIASPERYHAAQAEAALLAEKHVFVEKPVGLSSDEVRRQALLASEHKRVLLPGHILRFVPGYALGREWAARQQRIHSLFARRNVPAVRFAEHQRTHSALMSLTHDLDLLLWYLDGQQPERVYAVERRTVPGEGHPDVFWGLIEFSGGAVACVESLWTIPAGGSRYVDVELEISADEGLFTIRNPDDAVTIIDRDRTQHPDSTIDVLAQGRRFGALQAELLHFIELIQGRAVQPIVTIDDALRATLLAEMLISAAQERRVVSAEAPWPTASDT